MDVKCGWSVKSSWAVHLDKSSVFVLSKSALQWVASNASVPSCVFLSTRWPLRLWNSWGVWWACVRLCEELWKRSCFPYILAYQEFGGIQAVWELLNFHLQTSPLLHSWFSLHSWSQDGLNQGQNKLTGAIKHSSLTQDMFLYSIFTYFPVTETILPDFNWHKLFALPLNVLL